MLLLWGAAWIRSQKLYFLLLELFSKSFLRKQPNQLVTGWAVSLYKNVFVSVVGYLSTTLPLFTF